MTNLRPSQIAGTWYPGDAEELTALVDRCIAEAAPTDVVGDIVALVSPHAGLRYSGHIAAAAYRLVEGGSFDTVLLLGPCHQGGEGLAVIPAGAIETPLGRVRIDEELATALVAADAMVHASDAPHRNEHSVEVQFPFLHRFLPNVPVTPVLMGYQTPRTIAAAARAIERAIVDTRKKALIVASSDLSHYEPRAEASRLDGKVVRCLERFDITELEGLLRDYPHHACGGGPMVSVMTAARALGATSSSVLAYGDSGDESGDTTAVVGYVSAALFTAA